MDKYIKKHLGKTPQLVMAKSPMKVASTEKVEKSLKYQELIDKQKLTECPKNCKESELEAYRWVLTPLDNENNFLPVMQYSQKNNRPMRRLTSDDGRCAGCAGLSMFDSLENARNRFAGFEKKIQTLLGYTHVAAGQITKDMGIVSEISPDSGHFALYEYKNVDLRTTFTIASTIF